MLAGQSVGTNHVREPYDLTTAQADFPAREGTPDRSVVICSHPRSGSTLLGEAVYAAGGLGCPLEYLHRGFRPHFARRWQADDLASFVRAMHRHRTDATGVLSIKLFWRDVEEIVEESAAGRAPREIYDVLQTILPNPTFVLLTRRDRVRQAVSAFIAKETGVFRSFSGADSRPSGDVVYDYDGIVRQLAAADYGTARWREFFATLGIEPYRIEYEDLVSNYQAVAGSLLAHLGRPAAPRVPRMRRQAAAQSEAFVLRFLRDHEARAVSRSL
jgi:trehalose 2-sulfotransferase